jgi:YD repeat-containing protein
MTQYNYEDTRFSHHLTGLTDENGSRFAPWAYDAAGRGVSSEHAGGVGRVTFTYHPDGGTTATDAFPATGATRVTTHTYNDLGLLETVDGPRTEVGDVTRFTYDARGDLVSITNALDHLSEITAHDPHGRPLAIRDPNGTVTGLTYSYCVIGNTKLLILPRISVR